MLFVPKTLMKTIPDKNVPAGAALLLAFIGGIEAPKATTSSTAVSGAPASSRLGSDHSRRAPAACSCLGAGVSRERFE